MGLRDQIRTLEARKNAGQAAGQQLAMAYAEMCERKSSQRLMWQWYDRLEEQLVTLERYPELWVSAGEVWPRQMGWEDAQSAVRKWLIVQYTSSVEPDKEKEDKQCPII